jgi:UDP-N-acetylmuramate dehydrogenase
MEIKRNYCLKQYNTFGVDFSASVFLEYDNDDDIIEYVNSHYDKFKQVKHFVIGEGSNVLFSADYFGMIIHPKTEYLEIVGEDKEFIYINAASGIIWDDFVAKTLEMGAYGLENLSLIPGTVGASAVQNIGAYGAEVGNFINEVKFINLFSKEIRTISSQDCKFSYRNSVFKNELCNEVLILSVQFKMNKKFSANIGYADLINYFGVRKNINAQDVRDAVINIRNAKLPDPKIIGNAGSFFKNPVVCKDKFERLQKNFPDLKYYPQGDNEFKLAAGWLIDKCGLKGFEHNGAAVHDKQALVLINKNGHASGQEIKHLAYIIREKVDEKFGIVLEQEVIFV